MSRNVIYVGNAASNDISVFHLKEDGSAEPVQTAPFQNIDAAGSSTPLSVSPDRRFLYAGVRSEPYRVLSYAIDPQTGHLRQIGQAPLADSMAFLSTDGSGRFLFGASYGGSLVSVNPIRADGVAGEPAQVEKTGLNAHAIRPSPDNAHVFATNLGSDQVVAFRFDPRTGTLSPNAPPTIPLEAKSGPRHLCFSPDGRFVFLLDEHDGQVHAFGYEAATGAWEKRSAASILPENFSGRIWGAEVRVTPDGRFLYASERTSSMLTLVQIDTTSGALTAAGSFGTETQPRGFAIDPTGRYLVAAGERSDRITIHAIDPDTGALSALSSHPTGRQPNWVEIISLEED